MVVKTAFHTRLYAEELTQRFPSDSFEKLAGALVNAQVNLNPHQIDAALFAFKSPLSKGAILADEVGLGKTIEAGLVISQKWAERNRRILVITPAYNQLFSESLTGAKLYRKVVIFRLLNQIVPMSLSVPQLLIREKRRSIGICASSSCTS